MNPGSPPSWARLLDGESAEGADHRMRAAAVPVDRRTIPDRWSADDFANVTHEEMLVDFWGAAVPGSGAWDSMFVGAVASKSQLGFSVDASTAVLEEGLRARADGDRDHCVLLAERLSESIERAPRNPMHAYHMFDNSFEPALAAAGGRTGSDRRVPSRELGERIHAGWVGQIAGGAFGTALEGCTGPAIRSVYGTVVSYLGEVVTLNDDCVYELLALDVLDQRGLAASSGDLAAAWRDRLPFAWSAEWVALENLRHGHTPPASGLLRNPMHDWIGAQMRTMVYGLLFPARADLAMEFAARDSTISHHGNGVIGGLFAAALAAEAFVIDDPRELVGDVAGLLPARSEYFSVVDGALRICRDAPCAADAWTALDALHGHRNWIHAYPNIAAVIVALWFGGDDFTTAMSTLAQCGLDVDCNAGLVGTVLGVQRRTVPDVWSGPLRDRIDTYLPDAASVSITSVADRTHELAIRFDAGG